MTNLIIVVHSTVIWIQNFDVRVASEQTGDFPRYTVLVKNITWLDTVTILSSLSKENEEQLDKLADELSK